MDRGIMRQREASTLHGLISVCENNLHETTTWAKKKRNKGREAHMVLTGDSGHCRSQSLTSTRTTKDMQMRGSNRNGCMPKEWKAQGARIIQ
mmetsp:Transcript_25511/g.49908  ORF Transcript_25511/g.49908 Transcript_25511/m.49908 type:complete len:92 (-) Transcript_25511:238-513(-)